MKPRKYLVYNPSYLNRSETWFKMIENIVEAGRENYDENRKNGGRLVKRLLLIFPFTT